MYIDKPIREYLDDLAMRKPAPGGGSAAALAASIGTSLMSMVANYTIDNPKYKSVEKQVASLLVKAENYRGDLQRLIDKDVEAYNKLSKATAGYRDKPDTLDKLYKEATEVPIEICNISSECLKLCEVLAKDGNRNLITDTAIAALLLESAFFSAKFNVYENLKCIKDMEYIGRVHKSLQPLEERMPRLKEEILEICEEVILK